MHNVNLKTDFFKLAAILLVAAGIMVPLSTDLFAQQSPAGPPPIPREFMMVKQFLNLSDVQLGRLLELKQNFEKFARPRHEAIGQLERQLNELFASDHAAASSIGEIVLGQRALRQEIAAAQYYMMQAFLGTLEKEQAEKMGLIRMAASVQPMFEAFKALGLIAPPQPMPGF